jgi:hypothetical protein
MPQQISWKNWPKSEAQKIADRIDVIEKLLRKKRLSPQERTELEGERGVLMARYIQIIKMNPPKSSTETRNLDSQTQSCDSQTSEMDSESRG